MLKQHVTWEHGKTCNTMLSYSLQLSQQQAPLIWDKVQGYDGGGITPQPSVHIISVILLLAQL